MDLSHHTVRTLYVYERVRHATHRGRHFLLDNKDKLAT